MSTIAQVASDILAAPAPVICLDTCAILDVARAPARKQADSVPAAKALIQLAGSIPPAIHLLISDIVPNEWREHVGSAVKATRDAVDDFESVVHVSSTSGAVSISVPSQQIQQARNQLPPTLERLSRDLLDQGRLIDRDHEAMSAALDRVVGKRRPSRKNQVKDCYILEHYLAVARALGGPGFPHWVVFVSSNTEDFASAQLTTLHPDLVGDFNAVGMRYEVTIGRAVTALRAAGQI